MDTNPRFTEAAIQNQPKGFSRRSEMQGTSIGMVQKLSDREVATSESGIGSAIRELAGQISGVEILLQSLGDRLKPVRGTHPVKGGTPGEPSPAAGCQIEETLLALAHRVSAMGWQINDISDSLRV
jgi:hypothetical protein